MAITKIITPDLIDLKNSQLASGVATTYVVTVPAYDDPGTANKYFVNGVQQPNIVLIPGTQYVITQDDVSNSSHPILLSTSIANSGAYTTGVVYYLNGNVVTDLNAYITGFAAASARKIIVTLSSPPATLYYICYYHLNMGNTVITVGGDLNTDGVVLPKGATSNGNIGTTSILNFPTGAGCIAAYQFESDGTSTGSSSNDQTTVGTLTYSSGNFGNAVSGFGSGKYFETAGLFDSMFGTNPAREISFSVWIKTSSSNSQYICGARVSGGLAGMNMGIESNKFQTQISAASGNSGGAAGAAGGPYVRSSAVVNDGNWHNLVATYKSDGTTSGSGRGIINQYIDGVKVTSTSSFLQSGQTWTNGTANPWSSTGSAFYTGTYDATYYQFAGQIDQLRLYNKQLTDAQVLDIFDNSTYVIGTTGRPTTNLSDGEFRYNTTTKKVEFYDGTEWFALISSTSVPQAGTTGACNYPTTSNGELLMQLDNNINNTCSGVTPSMGAGTATFSSTAKYGSYSFQGDASRYIATNYSLTGKTNYTISIWFYNVYTGSSSQYIGGTTGSGTGNLLDGWLFNIKGSSASPAGSIDVIFRDTSSDIGRTKGGTTANNVWNNFCVTYDNGTATFYLNGSSSFTVTSGSNPMTNLSSGVHYDDLVIGAGGTNQTPNRWTGLLDQVRVYDSTLTQAQVAALYIETAP